MHCKTRFFTVVIHRLPEMIKKTGRFLNVYLSDVAPISSLAFTNHCTLPYSTAEEIKKKDKCREEPL
jgi:hypothetical protein